MWRVAGVVKVMVGSVLLLATGAWARPQEQVGGRPGQEAVLTAGGGMRVQPCGLIPVEPVRQRFGKSALQPLQGLWKPQPLRPIQNSTCRNFTVGRTCSAGGDECEFSVSGGQYTCI